MNLRNPVLRFILQPSALILAWIAAFALFFGALAVQQHQAFLTNGLDLGNVDQALWNTAQGRFLQFTLMAPVQSRLALHVEPILLFFVPFYWLGLGGPELLLIVQAAIVALGAWPLYRLSLINFQFANSSAPPSFGLRPSAFIPLAYLLLPALESAVLFDFHAVTLAPTFLLFGFWALVARRNGWFFVFMLLAMACKEDVPLATAIVGLYAGLAQRRWRLAGLTVGLSAVWFAVAVLVIQPRFAGGNIQLDRYAWLGDGPLAIGQTLVTQPGLVFDHLWHQAGLPGYLTDLFFPTAFLALFSPLTLLPMLPTLAVNLLSDNPFTWRLEDFHYGAPLAPFLFIAAIDGIRRIGEWAEPRSVANLPTSQSPNFPISQSPLVLAFTVLLLTFTVVYHYQRGYTPLARPFHWPQVTAHHRRLEQILQAIPADASVFAPSNLAPHLSQRRTIYADFGYFTDPAFPAPAPVEEVLLDVTTFENFGGLHQFLRQTLLANGDYRVVTAADGILRLQPPTAESQSPTPYSLLPTPFLTFAQPTTPAGHLLTVDFGDAIRLHGFTLHFNRQEEVQVSVDLEPLRPLAADVRPVLYLLDAAGQPAGATLDWQPALVWFPPDQWTPGETVRVRFNTLPWYTRRTGSYRLALGLVGGENVWAIDRRLRPALAPAGPLATRLPAGGTLVELARLEQSWGIPGGGPWPRQFGRPQPPFPTEANFDHQIKLLGYAAPTVGRINDSDSDYLTLSLVWQALAGPPPLTRFVQLVGPAGKVYGQQDSTPDNGAYPTYLWQPGEVVAETVAFPLPPDRPPGRYTLHLGFYHPDTLQRLPLIAGGDHVEIDGPFSNVN
ncbi:MAG: DUF2079 domain-containing protein [Chloroflexota bacterium]